MAGGEGAFIMVTFWLVEAMARVSFIELPQKGMNYANQGCNWKLRLPNMMCLFQISGNSHFRTLITSCLTRITWECFLKKWPFLVSRWATPHRLSVTWPVSVLQLIWEELDELVVTRSHLSIGGS